ncbi:MAG TPA: VIT domain-containing protein [Candidatus Hydrogenedentes bacterium]|nr:VIT domain-containing protein [Candidatus Hydrogenedentota bacterium]
MTRHDGDEVSGFGVYGKGGPVKLGMQDLLLTGTVLPVGARLVVRHVFRSEEKKPLEMIYAFALPRDAALRRFRITGDRFEAESELRPTAKARETYERGIERGSLSALAQTYQDGVTNLNVGNIRPGETVTVFLEIAAGVEFHDDGFRFRFPFTLAPGYHARAACGVADDGAGEISLPEELFGDVVLPRWKADAEGLHGVSFDLNVAAPQGAELVCPSHPVSVGAGADGGLRVRLATAGDLPNRDVVLETRGSAAERPSVFAGVDGAGRGRFAAVVPSGCFGRPERPAKRVVFLLDHSGSMDGVRLEQAKAAVCACLEALRPEDRFGIVLFESRVRPFRPELLPATPENLSAARAFVGAVEAAGGTELAAGVGAAAKMIGKDGDLLLVTDGEVFGGDDLLARVRACGARVHCLGIGSASQDRMLALLARESGGVGRFLGPREDVAAGVLALFRGVGAVLAANVRCAAKGLKQAEWLPEPADAVREGQPWVLFGACDGLGDGTLSVTWDGGGLDIPVRVGESPLGEALKLVQGARLVTDTDALFGDAPEGSRKAQRLTRRLEALGSEYGLASRALSLVSVVRRAGDRPGEVPETRVVATGMPGDAAFNAYFGDPSDLSVCATPMMPGAIRACLSAAPGVRMRHVSADFCLCEDSAAFPLPGGRFSARTARLVLVRLATLIVRFAALQDGGILNRHFTPLRRITAFLRRHEDLWPVGVPAEAVRRLLADVERRAFDSVYRTVDTAALAALAAATPPDEDALRAALARFFREAACGPGDAP